MDGTATDAPVLGVARSVTGRRWVWRPSEARTGLGIAQRLGLPEMVGRLLAARGVVLDAAAAYLDPTLRALMPDPASLIDMDAAADRIAAAVRSGEHVAVFGDYDVDGACSGALMSRLLRDLGCEVTPYVPDRLKEGYGPNAPAIAALCDRGASLIVCVDCGIAAAEALAAAEGRADVVVLDHHKAEGPAPRILRRSIRIGSIAGRGCIMSARRRSPSSPARRRCVCCAAPDGSSGARSRTCWACSTWWRWRRCAT